jgi:hypothetical protein
MVEIEKEAIMGNETQDTSTSSGLLITLCTLTIIGSVFGILRAFLYEFGAMVAEVATGSNMDMTYVRGLLYVAFHTGTLIGAIIMLCRSMVGFYMYTISQILYIVFVLYTTYATYDARVFEAIIGAMFWGPSLVFLILYWTLPTRKHLK